MKIQVLVNQVGYDLHGSKISVLQSDFDTERNAVFSVVDRWSGTTVYKGLATYFGKIYQNTRSDWGFWYWKMDFSDLLSPGTFYIEAELKGKRVKSYPFEVGDNIIWIRSIGAAFEYLSGLHYSEPNDGVLRDDMKFHDVTGGWSVGYIPAKHLRDSSKILQGVVLAYQQNPGFFSEQQRDELLYGARWFKKAMIHYPRSGRMIGNVGEMLGTRHIMSKTGIKGREITWFDKPMHVAGHYKLICIYLLAELDRLFPNHDFLNYSKKMWEYYENGIWSDKIFDFLIIKERYPESEVNFKNDVFLDDDALLLLGDVSLYRSTKDPKYLEHAEEIVDKLSSAIKSTNDYWVKYSMAQWYDSAIPVALATFALQCRDSSRSFKAKEHAKCFMDQMVEDAFESNPFGLSRYCREWLPFTPQYSVKGHTFFADKKIPDRVNNEGKGLNPYYAWRAYEALLVQQLQEDNHKKQMYERFARSQINWILGCNPINSCMMYGIGQKNPQIIPGLRVPFEFRGGICHGIFSRMHTDAPALSVSENQAIREGHQKWAGAEIITRGTGYFLQGISYFHRHEN